MSDRYTLAVFPTRDALTPSVTVMGAYGSRTYSVTEYLPSEDYSWAVKEYVFALIGWGNVHVRKIAHDTYTVTENTE